jgi:hypothetical protein
LFLYATQSTALQFVQTQFAELVNVWTEPLTTMNHQSSFTLTMLPERTRKFLAMLNLVIIISDAPPPSSLSIANCRAEVMKSLWAGLNFHAPRIRSHSFAEPALAMATVRAILALLRQLTISIPRVPKDTAFLMMPSFESIMFFAADTISQSNASPSVMVILLDELGQTLDVCFKSHIELPNALHRRLVSSLTLALRSDYAEPLVYCAALRAAKRLLYLNISAEEATNLYDVARRKLNDGLPAVAPDLLFLCTLFASADSASLVHPPAAQSSSQSLLTQRHHGFMRLSSASDDSNIAPPKPDHNVAVGFGVPGLRAQQQLLLDFFCAHHQAPHRPTIQSLWHCAAASQTSPFHSHTNFLSNLSRLIEWAANECAKGLVETKLVSHFGPAKKTLEIIEQSLLDCLKAPSASHQSESSLLGIAHQRAYRLLLLLFAMQRHIDAIVHGSMLLDQSASEPVIAFFSANYRVCCDWFSRIAPHATTVSSEYQLYYETIRLGMARCAKMVESHQRLSIPEISQLAVMLERACSHTNSLEEWIASNRMFQNLLADNNTTKDDNAVFQSFLHLAELQMRGKAEEALPAAKSIVCNSPRDFSYPLVVARCLEIASQCCMELQDWTTWTVLRSAVDSSTISQVDKDFLFDERFVSLISSLDVLDNNISPLLAAWDKTNIPTSSVEWIQFAITRLVSSRASNLSTDAIHRVLGESIAACALAVEKNALSPKLDKMVALMFALHHPVTASSSHDFLRSCSQKQPPNSLFDLSVSSLHSILDKSSTAPHSWLVRLVETQNTNTAVRILNQQPESQLSEWWFDVIRVQHLSGDVLGSVHGALKHIHSIISTTPTSLEKLTVNAEAVEMLAQWVSGLSVSDFTQGFELLRQLSYAIERATSSMPTNPTLWHTLACWATQTVSEHVKPAEAKWPNLSTHQSILWHRSMDFVTAFGDQLGNEAMDVTQFTSEQQDQRKVYYIRALLDWNSVLCSEPFVPQPLTPSSPIDISNVSAEAWLIAVFPFAEAEAIQEFEQLALRSCFSRLFSPITAIQSWTKYLECIWSHPCNGLHTPQSSAVAGAVLQLLQLFRVHSGLACCEDHIVSALLNIPLEAWVPVTNQLTSLALHLLPFGWLSTRIWDSIVTVVENICINHPHAIIHLVMAHQPNSSESQQRDILTIARDLLKHSHPQLMQEYELFHHGMLDLSALWEERLLAITHSILQAAVTPLNQLEEERVVISSQDPRAVQQTGSSTELAATAQLLLERYQAVVEEILAPLHTFLNHTSIPATPHERVFQQHIRPDVMNALSAISNPNLSSPLHQAWSPMRTVAKNLRDGWKSRRFTMAEVCPPLLDTRWNLKLPGTNGVRIVSCLNDIAVLATKSRPKKIVLLGENGSLHTYLLKGREDVNLDASIQHCFQLANRVLAENAQGLRIRTYAILPLATGAGLIRFVDGVTSVFALYRHHFAHVQRSKIAIQHAAQGKTQSSRSKDSRDAKLDDSLSLAQRPSDHFFSKLTPLLKAHGISAKAGRDQWPTQILDRVFTELVEETPAYLLSNELQCASMDAKELFTNTARFARSNAVMSILGYVLGVGDRHLENILIDWATAEVIHIDFNISYDHGLALRVPECVPFRLTRNFVHAFGVGQLEGHFKETCRTVATAMYRSRHVVSALMDAFAIDAEIDWTSSSHVKNEENIRGRVNEEGALKLLPTYLEEATSLCLPNDLTSHMTTCLSDLFAAFDVHNRYQVLQHEWQQKLQEAQQLGETISMVHGQITELDSQIQTASWADQHARTSLAAVSRELEGLLRQCAQIHSAQARDLSSLRLPHPDLLAVNQFMLTPSLPASVDANLKRAAEQYDLCNRKIIHHLGNYHTLLQQLPSSYIHASPIAAWHALLEQFMQDSQDLVCREETVAEAFHRFSTEADDLLVAKHRGALVELAQTSKYFGDFCFPSRAPNTPIILLAFQPWLNLNCGPPNVDCSEIFQPIQTTLLQPSSDQNASLLLLRECIHRTASELQSKFGSIAENLARRCSKWSCDLHEEHEYQDETGKDGTDHSKHRTLGLLSTLQETWQLCESALPLAQIIERHFWTVIPDSFSFFSQASFVAASIHLFVMSRLLPEILHIVHTRAFGNLIASLRHVSMEEASLKQEYLALIRLLLDEAANVTEIQVRMTELDVMHTSLIQRIHSIFPPPLSTPQASEAQLCSTLMAMFEVLASCHNSGLAQCMHLASNLPTATASGLLMPYLASKVFFCGACSFLVSIFDTLDSFCAPPFEANPDMATKGKQWWHLTNAHVSLIFGRYVSRLLLPLISHTFSATFAISATAPILGVREATPNVILMCEPLLFGEWELLNNVSQPRELETRAENVNLFGWVSKSVQSTVHQHIKSWRERIATAGLCPTTERCVFSFEWQYRAALQRLNLDIGNGGRMARVMLAELTQALKLKNDFLVHLKLLSHTGPFVSSQKLSEMAKVSL